MLLKLQGMFCPRSMEALCQKKTSQLINLRYSRQNTILIWLSCYTPHSLMKKNLLDLTFVEHSNNTVRMSRSQIFNLLHAFQKMTKVPDGMLISYSKLCLSLKMNKSKKFGAAAPLQCLKLLTRHLKIWLILGLRSLLARSSAFSEVYVYLLN